MLPSSPRTTTLSGIRSARSKIGPTHAQFIAHLAMEAPAIFDWRSPVLIKDLSGGQSRSVGSFCFGSPGSRHSPIVQTLTAINDAACIAASYACRSTRFDVRNILIHADDGPGMAARMESGLAIGRRHRSHLDL